MALTVEDGTGLALADSYVSLTDVTDYYAFSGLPNAHWTALTDTEKEAKLRFASLWADSNFKWRSYRKSTSQALSFPRLDYYDSDGLLVTGIPKKFKYGIIEIASLHILSPLNVPNAAGTKVLQEAVGQSSVTYKQGDSLSVDLKYALDFLRDYGRLGIGMKETVRC